MSPTRREFLGCVAAFSAAPLRAAPAPIVAAAASLRFAMAALTAAFPGQLRVVFGSSGTLAQQMRSGAPYEIFLSADESYVQRLASESLLRDEGVIYARGRLSVIAPMGGELTVDSSLDGLAARLNEGRLRRFAIATPEHAPYGVSAREALVHRGLWSALQPHLIFGENVAQTAQFATSGSADGGLVASSIAMAGPVSDASVSSEIPESWHRPLFHRMALSSFAGAQAAEFFAFLQRGTARAILMRHGFAAPETL